MSVLFCPRCCRALPLSSVPVGEKMVCPPCGTTSTLNSDGSLHPEMLPEQAELPAAPPHWLLPLLGVLGVVALGVMAFCIAIAPFDVFDF